MFVPCALCRPAVCFLCALPVLCYFCCLCLFRSHGERPTWCCQPTLGVGEDPHPPPLCLHAPSWHPGGLFLALTPRCWCCLQVKLPGLMGLLDSQLWIGRLLSYSEVALLGFCCLGWRWGAPVLVTLCCVPIMCFPSVSTGNLATSPVPGTVSQARGIPVLPVQSGLVHAA